MGLDSGDVCSILSTFCYHPNTTIHIFLLPSKYNNTYMADKYMKSKTYIGSCTKNMCGGFLRWKVRSHAFTKGHLINLFKRKSKLIFIGSFCSCASSTEVGIPTSPNGLFSLFLGRGQFPSSSEFPIRWFPRTPKIATSNRINPLKSSKKNLEMEELTGKKVFFLIIYKSKNHAIRKFNWMIQK